MFDSILIAAKHDHDRNRKFSRFNRKQLKSIVFELSFLETPIEEDSMLETSHNSNFNSSKVNSLEQIMEHEDALIAKSRTVRRKSILEATADVVNPAAAAAAAAAVNSLELITEQEDALIAKSKTVRRRSILEPKIDQSVFTLTENHETLLELQRMNSDIKNGRRNSITQSIETLDPALLSQWYELDKSFTTPVYVLKPIR